MKIAEVVRAWAEAYQWAFGFPYTLAGLCCPASFLIFREIKRAGGKPKLCWNDDHAFVLFKNKIIDVTATQFGLKEKVVITDPPIEIPYYWEPIEATESIKVGKELLMYFFSREPYVIISSFKRFLVDGNVNL